MDERSNFFIALWRGSDCICGTEVLREEYQQTKRYAPDPRKWLFKGIWANVWVISPYGNVTRSEALKFATDWMKGKTVTYHVNLDRCNFVLSNGIEKTPDY